MYKTYKLILKGVLAVLFIGIVFLLGNFAESNDLIKEIVSSYGYFGIFIISLFGGFNFFVPIPVASFIPLFLESGLSFAVTILIISLGLTMADIITYFIGNLGREAFLENNKKMFLFFEKTKNSFRYAPYVILFIYISLAPLPNEIFVIPLAFFGYKLRFIIPITFLGNIIFNSLFGQGFVKIFEFL